MRILALDTTARRFGACLWEDGRCREIDVQAEAKHDALIERALARLFGGDAGAGRRPPLDAIAAATGPGRFTGIRVGVAFAVMLGKTRGIPVIGLRALETLACQAFWESEGAQPAAVVAARPVVRSEMFWGAYRPAAGGVEAVFADRWGLPQDLKGSLAGLPRPLALAGESARTALAGLGEDGAGVRVLAERLRPRSLARRAAEILERGGPLPPPEPYYLKPGNFERGGAMTEAVAAQRKGMVAPSRRIP